MTIFQGCQAYAGKCPVCGRPQQGNEPCAGCVNRHRNDPGPWWGGLVPAVRRAVLAIWARRRLEILGLCALALVLMLLLWGRV